MVFKIYNILIFQLFALFNIYFDINLGLYLFYCIYICCVFRKLYNIKMHTLYFLAYTPLKVKIQQNIPFQLTQNIL